jgi:hypothetical protein
MRGERPLPMVVGEDFSENSSICAGLDIWVH